MTGLSLEQSENVHQIALLAFLGMAARSVAGAEFEASPEVGSIRVTVARPAGTEQASIDVEILDRRAFPVGGMSI